MALKDIRNSRKDEEFVPVDAGEHADNLLNIIQKMKTGYWPVIDVEYGWYDIIVRLDAKLTSMCHNYYITRLRKSKGNATFSYFISNVEDRELLRKMIAEITAAQLIAQQTCEKCGSKGKETPDGMSVLCSSHAVKIKKVRQRRNDNDEENQ
jgi:hypothetical protein